VRVGLAYNVKPADTPITCPRTPSRSTTPRRRWGTSRMPPRLGHDVLVFRRNRVRGLRAERRPRHRLQHRGRGRRAVPRGARPGRPGDARRPFRRLRSADPLRYLDKPVAKRLVSTRASHRRSGPSIRGGGRSPAVSFPVIVKPAFEGSSKGVGSLPRDDSRPGEGDGGVRHPDVRQDAMVEAFVPGAEVTVGVLGNDPPRVAGMMEIVRRRSLRRSSSTPRGEEDWENRVAYRVRPRCRARSSRRSSGARWDLPDARMPRLLPDRLPAGRGRSAALHRVHPLPGLSRGYGDLPIMADRMGIPYQSLVGEILSHACTASGCSPHEGLRRRRRARRRPVHLRLRGAKRGEERCGRTWTWRSTRGR